MKVTKIEDLHADAGWSEYTGADGSRGLSAIIHGLAEFVIGQDPRRVRLITSMLLNRTIQARRS